MAFVFFVMTGADQVGVDVVGDRVAVDQHRHGADRRHGQRRRDERVAGDDDLVAGLDAGRLEGQPQRVEARADADGVLRADHRREALLEGLDFGAEDVLAVQQDLLHGGLDLVAHGRVMGGEINERYDVHESPLDAKSEQEQRAAGCSTTP